MSARIKICFILSHFVQGGAERQTLNLIRELDKRVYDITLLIYGSIDIFYSEIYDMPIVHIVRKSHFRNKIMKHILNAYFLRKFLKKRDFDILHTLLFHNGFWVRLLAPRKYNQRIIFSVRNDLKSCPKYMLLFEKLFIKKSYVVSNNYRSKLQYQHLVGEKHKHRIFNIYNGFFINKYFSKTYLPLKGTLVLGNVASQSRKKNQIQLLQAVKNLVEIIPLHLFIIGSPTPSTSSELRQYLLDFSLSSHVTILNAQPNIEDYYKKFHVFVLSSFYEGCPNVLFEAMLSKCLCIVSDGDNSDNYIKDGVNGLVYNGELMELEAKIRQAFMLIKSGRSDKIIETGQSYAAANFNVERMVEGYEHLYYRIAEDN